MPPFIPRFSQLLLWRGITCILLGVCTLFWPGISLKIVLIIFGLYMLADGLVQIFASVGHVQHDREWWIHLFRGVMSTILGIFTLLAPFFTAVVLVYYIACWLMVIGVVEIIVGIRLRKRIKGEGWYIAGGIVTLLLACLIIVFPLSSAVNFIWVLGIYALLYGIALLSAYVRIRRRHAKAVLNSGSPA
jgi:uncharacterized membrane protein HdeD (DUF308 family)